jgi:uncharacterized protein (DUF2147 family)
MKKTLTLIALTATFALTTAASALDPSKMIGKWKWESYVINVTNGGSHKISAKVTSGPKNIGMEMIQSNLKPKGDSLVGSIKHPATGDIYKAKLTLINADTWSMNGCTSSGVCAEGKFTRVK